MKIKLENLRYKKYIILFKINRFKKILMIIADRIIQRMRKGYLITHPNDNRVYKGIFENATNIIKNFSDKHRK